jgi:hypothetical protein
MPAFLSIVQIAEVFEILRLRTLRRLRTSLPLRHHRQGPLQVFSSRPVLLIQGNPLDSHSIFRYIVSGIQLHSMSCRKAEQLLADFSSAFNF